MADVRLISAGDDIKLWDGDNYTLLKQINPHGHNISSLAWTQDNTLLASTSANNDKVALTYVNQPSRQLPEIPIENQAGGLCLDFNSNSRYLLVGRSDNALSIYDCKSKRYKKSYTDHKGPVTTAQFNFNDSYIAAGSETGGIVLHHVVTGQGCTPLMAPNVQAIRQVQYSFYKKSWLASASDDGAINLWDTNTRRLLHSFSEGHRAPASGVAFSPLSDVLLCSVGLDKRIHIYDLALKKILHTYMAESPLTSIDFMHDGTTFAAGSTRGKIYIYDLRQGRTPQKILSAHRSSVQALRFRNNPIRNPNSSGQSGGKVAQKVKGVSPNLRRNLPPAPADDPVKVTQTPESVNTVSRLRGAEDEMTVEDIFSPIREGFEESRERSGLHSNSNSTTGSFNAIDGGVFSPLAENASMLKVNRLVAGAEVNYVTSPLAGNVHTSLTSQRGSSFTQPQHALVSEQPDPVPSVAVLETSPVISHPLPPPVNSLPQHSASQSPHRSALINSRSENFTTKPGSPRHRDVSASPSLPLLDRALDRGGEAATGTANGPLPPRNINFEENLLLVPSGGDSMRSPEGALASSHEQGRYAQYPAPHSIPDRGDNCAEAQGKSLAIASSQPNPAPQQAQPFQQQVIRHLIEEAMEDFREQVHRDMLAMHTEMIRQFHIQLAEMQTTVQRFSVNEELLAEVERLREENKRLRKTF